MQNPTSPVGKFSAFVAGKITSLSPTSAAALATAIEADINAGIAIGEDLLAKKFPAAGPVVTDLVNVAEDLVTRFTATTPAVPATPAA